MLGTHRRANLRQSAPRIDGMGTGSLFATTCCTIDSTASTAPDVLEALRVEVAGVQLGDDHGQLVDAQRLGQLRVLARLPAARAAKAARRRIEPRLEPTYSIQMFKYHNILMDQKYSSRVCPPPARTKLPAGTVKPDSKPRPC